LSTFRKITGFLGALRRGSDHYRIPFPVALRRSLDLYLRSAFSRKEIIGYALYVPSIAQSMPVLVSKDRSLAKLAVLNPPALQYRTESKDEFYRLCARHGLAFPTTYGWTKQGQWFDFEGKRIDTEREWAAYLSSRLPEHFIVKDRDGAYGSGFRAYRRSGDTFTQVDTNAVHRIDDLIATFAVDRDPSGIVIQQRLFDEPSLSDLCGRVGLQTARINTLIEPDGRVSILFYMIKILAGHTVSDNFSMGTTGNLIAFGDEGTGVLRQAVTIHECGSGMNRIGRHPVTGKSFDGFQLPCWKEAIELVTAGQRHFAELPTLGWDVALTSEGPLIIEANARWDPPLYAPFLMSGNDWKRIFGD
jgi:Sugar-transfer associated ATP-grasp